MRIKLLSVIIGFFAVSLSFTSCLKSDDKYEYSSDATIHAFGLDTVHGKHYQFTIDQLKGEIYNVDSLPVGSDTIINHILIDTLATASGIVTSGVNDTILNIRNPQDLRSPIALKVHAADGTTVRIYKVKVNVHKQDPDSLVWQNKGKLALNAPTKGSKAALLYDKSNNADRILLYTSENEVYTTVTNASSLQWEYKEVSGLPTDVKLSTITNFKNNLYVATESGNLYCSDNGFSWSKVNIGTTQITSLLASFSNRLSAMQQIDNEFFFCRSYDGINWDKGDKVSEEFPSANLYSTVFTTNTGTEKALLVGNTLTSDKKAVVPYFSYNDESNGWADMTTPSDFYCPYMLNPTIINYGGSFYIFGGDFKSIYTSETGIAWYKTKKKFLLPAEMAGNYPYSMVVDKNNYIWVLQVEDSSSSQIRVWKGRLNRLGFIQQ